MRNKFEKEYESWLIVAERIPNDGLFNLLNSDPERLTNTVIKTLKYFGSSFSPATNAETVY